MAGLGVFILWLGWFGFNPGSTTAVGPGMAYIAVMTNLSACAGAVSTMIMSWVLFKKAGHQLCSERCSGGTRCDHGWL